MKFVASCILTDNAPRLAEFYTILSGEKPLVEGSHYGFNGLQLAVYDPGNVIVSKYKNMSLMFYVSDLQAEYERLLREIPDIVITSPPEHRPWGAFSFWFLDPDGKTISFIEKDE
jgi:catechol 2,3-dioxygenase-like lactoylglutathione lyase family enzyme